MNRYVTFGNAAYDEQIAKTAQLVRDHNTNSVPFGTPCELLVYDDAWLEQQEFRRVNSWLWDHPHKRGYGWYAWKPFVILDALNERRSGGELMYDGDVALYVDADTYPISPDFTKLFDLCRKEGGVLLFEATGHSNRQWCKRDCNIVMGHNPWQPWCKDSICSWCNCQHVVARFCAFQKGSWLAQQILMEWLTYCVNPLATTFDRSILAPELPGFIEHRTEQAILTLLAHKHGVRLHREACQAGNGRQLDWDLYPQLFVQVDHVDREHHETLPVARSRFRNFE